VVENKRTIKEIIIAGRIIIVMPGGKTSIISMRVPYDDLKYN